MPPKKGKKEQAPKKDLKKATADKTFGLKNKNKSSKVQKYVREVEQAAQSTAQAKKEAANAKRKLEEKKAAEAAKAEAMALFNAQVVQKVPFGVDPKSVLCVLFRDGKCLKGPKCKFSHDMNIGKRATKKDLYTDDRAKKEADTMDQWDEEKLRSVIKSKNNNRTTTDKVCKYFIEAVEDGKYGWFWVCPNNGNECKYRHSLPEGFVLKTKEQKRLEKMAIDQQPKITLEEFIETERHKLPKTGLTPITVETFAKWKENNKIRRLNAMKNDKQKLTGREIIQKRFLDKNYVEDNDESTQAFDLAELRKELGEEKEEFNNVSFDQPTVTKAESNTDTTTTIVTATTTEPVETESTVSTEAKEAVTEKIESESSNNVPVQT